MPEPRFEDVAVIIPCFNDGHVVNDAVTSALAEGANEVVIVDDGSTDMTTEAVLVSLERQGIRVIRQSNTGLAGARTRGLHSVNTPYVMVLDADDQIAPGALSAMVEALRSDPRLAVVWGDVERFGRAGYILHRKGRTLDPWRITFVNELVASTMVRRDAVIRAGGWSLEDAFEDWDLWMAMAELGMQGRHVGMTTLRYRVDDPRMYRNALSRYGELVETLESRHGQLFANRPTSRTAAAAGRSLKVAWTIIAGLPMPRRIERYLLFGALVCCEPAMRRGRH